MQIRIFLLEYYGMKWYNLFFSEKPILYPLKWDIVHHDPVKACWDTKQLWNVVIFACFRAGWKWVKRLGVFLLPPGWDTSPSQGYPSVKFAGTYLYNWAERGAMRVKCLAQEHNGVPWPGLEPRLLYPESGTLAIRPPRLLSQEVLKNEWQGTI